MQTFRNQCGCAVYKSHFYSILQFFLHNYERFDQLNPQQFLWRRRRGMFVTTLQLFFEQFLRQK